MLKLAATVLLIAFYTVSFGNPYTSQADFAGEPLTSSIILQTRLTESSTVDTTQYMPGAEGWAAFEISDNLDFVNSWRTGWIKAREEDSYIVKATLDNLAPGKVYFYRVLLTDNPGQGYSTGQPRSFITAPDENADTDVVFSVVTSHRFFNLDNPKGFNGYHALINIKPDFHVMTGDNVYYDTDLPKANNVKNARFHWQRMYSMDYVKEFFSMVPAFWMKDDHDYRFDDADPFMKTFKPMTDLGVLSDEEGRKLFLEQAPVPKKTYRTAHWGRNLQIWLPEGRDFRSPNNWPDGEGKTIWGVEQRRWLLESIKASDATFKLLVSPTPMIGPDSPNKIDNHCNRKGFFTEGRGFLKNLREAGVENFYIVCGDRHWKYYSEDKISGYQEFSCGALTDGASVKEPEKYSDPDVVCHYSLGNGGFLLVRVEAENVKTPLIHFEFYEEDGRLDHTETREYTE